MSQDIKAKLIDKVHEKLQDLQSHEDCLDYIGLSLDTAVEAIIEQHLSTLTVEQLLELL